MNGSSLTNSAAMFFLSCSEGRDCVPGDGKAPRPIAGRAFKRAGVKSQ